MINGVLMIVAAVLFGVLYLFEKLSILWLWVAGFYLAAGVVNLVSHALREKWKVHTANKKAEKIAREAEDSRREAEEAKKKLSESGQEVNV
jgi:predicted membrane protein